MPPIEQKRKQEVYFTADQEAFNKMYKIATEVNFGPRNRVRCNGCGKQGHMVKDCKSRRGERWCAETFPGGAPAHGDRCKFEHEASNT